MDGQNRYLVFLVQEHGTRNQQYICSKINMGWLQSIINY